MGCNPCCCVPRDEQGRLDCCKAKDKAENELSKDEKQWRGFIKDEDRKCTDIICCLIYAAFMIGFLVIGIIALVEGEPSRLVAGQDYKGRTCGHSDGVKDAPRIMYPRTNEDLIANAGREPQDFAFYGICVEECNTKDTEQSIVVVCNEELSPDVSAAVNKWPSAAQSTLLDPNSGCFGSPFATSSSNNVVGGHSFTCAELSENCWVVPVFTSNILTRCIPVFEFNNTATATCAYPRPVNGTSLEPTDDRCVLVTETSSGSVTRPRDSSLLFDQLNDASQTWGRYINDLQSTWWVIVVCAIVIGLVLGYMFLFLIKYCVGIVVWLTIIFTLLLSVALTAFLYYKAGVITSDAVDSFADRANSANSPSADEGSRSTTVDQSAKVSSDSDNETAFRVAAYIMTGITVVILVMVIALRKSISVAIDVIKLGADAVNALSWEALVAPMIPVLLLFGLLAYWLFVTVALFSVPGSSEELNSAAAANATASGSFFNGTSSYSVITTPTNQSLRYMIIYAFFGLLWTNQFLVGMTIMMLGGAVAGWYFSKGDESVAKAGLKYEQPALPVFTSLWRAMKFHMGSVAVGSFLIATVQFIRAVMYYIEQQARKGQENNRLIKLIFMCIQCILWCIECILKIITRNAYLVTAIKGWSFCPSAAYALGIVMNNFAVISFVNVMVEIIMFLGKCFIATLCAFIALGIIDSTESFQEGGEDEVTAAWLPGIITFLFAYVVATAFFVVFDLAVDGILISYIMDRDENYRANGNKEAFRKPIHIEGEDTLAAVREKHTAKEDDDAAPGNGLSTQEVHVNGASAHKNPVASGNVEYK